MSREVLASAVVPNGRWGDHHISVERRNGEVLWRNGWNDPLVCDDVEQAMRFFNERVSEAALHPTA